MTNFKIGGKMSNFKDRITMIVADDYITYYKWLMSNTRFIGSVEYLHKSEITSATGKYKTMEQYEKENPRGILKDY